MSTANVLRRRAGRAVASAARPMIAAGLALTAVDLLVSGTPQLVLATAGFALVIWGAGNWAMVVFWRCRRGEYRDLPPHPVWAVLGLMSLAIMVALVVIAGRSPETTLLIPVFAGLILVPDVVTWRFVRNN